MGLSSRLILLLTAFWHNVMHIRLPYITIYADYSAHVLAFAEVLCLLLTSKHDTAKVCTITDRNLVANDAKLNNKWQ